MIQDPNLPSPTQYQLNPFEQELLRKLDDIFIAHKREIEQRPCCAIEDPMWWLLK